jgi:protoheme IX farnesyltransferase
MSTSVLEPIAAPADMAATLVVGLEPTPPLPLCDAVVPCADSTAALLRKLADYIELTKPRIAIMALVTVAVGSVLASRGSLDAVLLVHTIFATGLVAAAASVLNQVLERDTDALMRRTRNRPLPAGRVSPSEAWLFGGVLATIGIGYLSVAVNPLTGLLGLVTLVLYAFAYTPLKRTTSLNTVIGAVPGALPPVMGWAAVRGSLDAEAGMLFLILFLWQFPHFLAIAWLYRDDYARAGLKMLPVIDPAGGMTARQMIGYSLALVPASLAPSMAGLTGPAYFYGALWLGLVLLGYAVAFALSASQTSARNLMRASLVYLPVLLMLMVWDFAQM